MDFFDTHVHLQVLDEASVGTCLARTAGQFWCQSIVPSDWVHLIELQARWPERIRIALGVHPWYLHTVRIHWAALLGRLHALLQRHPTAGIGEIGLDFDRRTVMAPARQCELFEAQLALAQSLARPCSIHLRKGFEEAWRLLSQHDFRRAPVFLHGFSGGIHWAERFASLGCLIGVNGIICRANARRYHEMVRALPLSVLVLETDGPFVKLPGRTRFACEDLLQVAETVARLKRVSVEAVLAQSRKNAESGWKHDAG